MWAARGLVLLALIAADVGAPWPASAQPLAVGVRPGSPRIFIPPPVRFRRRRLPRLLPPPPPGMNLPPRVGRVSPLLRDRPEVEPPLPHGFALTVPVDPEGPPGRPQPVARYDQVGAALGTCWRPPSGADWSAMTVRIAFKRDGSIYGEPRVPFVEAGAATSKGDLSRSLLSALRSCAPLPFSPALGSAVAGEIFAIRFINKDKATDDRH